jgi:hypothetical protein
MTCFIANADAFSVSTQIYVRMRRVTGRVIDAMYVVQVLYQPTISIVQHIVLIRHPLILVPAQ